METYVDITGVRDMLLEHAVKSTRNRRMANLALSEIPESDYKDMLTQLAYDTFDTSQFLVPVDTGLLKSTGKVSVENNYAEIIYDTSYAGYVHEILSYHHEYPTQAKYIQEAFTIQVYKLVRTYGFESIPDFDINLSIDESGAVSLKIFYSKKQAGMRGKTWRRWIGT